MPSSYEQFQQLFNQIWPNIKPPTIDYEVLPPRPTDTLQSITYTGRMRLLGQTLSAHGHYASPEEALNATAKVALDVLAEFNRLLDLSSNGSNGLTPAEQEYVSVMMRSLSQEASEAVNGKTELLSPTAALNHLNTTLSTRQNEQIDAGVKERTAAISQKFDTNSSEPSPAETSRMERLRQKLLSEMQEGKDPIKEAPKDPRLSREPPKEPLTQPVKPVPPPPPTNTTPSQSTSQSLNKKTALMDPITTLHEYVEKSGSAREQLIFQEFRHQNRFGYRLLWNNQSWVSPATSQNKRDAKMHVALMACVEILGNGFVFEGIDPSVYANWTPEYIQGIRDRYIFRTTSELLGSSKIDTNTTSQADASDTPPLVPLDPLPNGLKYVNELNQLCQRLKWSLPIFTFTSINAVSNYYVCTIRDFQEFPLFESAPFTRKADAKEDVAGRLYLALKQAGYLEEAARLKRLDQQSSRDRGKDRGKDRLSQRGSVGSGSGSLGGSMDNLSPPLHQPPHQHPMPSPHLPMQPPPHIHLMQMQAISSSFYYLTRMQAQLAGTAPPMTPQEIAQMNQLIQQQQQLMMMSMSSMGGPMGGPMGPMSMGPMPPMGPMGASMSHIPPMPPMSPMNNMPPIMPPIMHPNPLHSPPNHNHNHIPSSSNDPSSMNRNNDRYERDTSRSHYRSDRRDDYDRDYDMRRDDYDRRDDRDYDREYDRRDDRDYDRRDDRSYNRNRR